MPTENLLEIVGEAAFVRAANEGREIRTSLKVMIRFHVFFNMFDSFY